MGNRALYSFEIKPQALASLRYLENHVLTMPNRIENIRVRAANQAVRKLQSYLRSNYGSAGRGMVVEPSFGVGTVKIVIKAQRAKASGGKANGAEASNFAANILLYGRKSYTARRGPGDKAYKLRDASTPPYPRSLRRFKVKAMSPNHSARMDIRKEASSLLMDAIYTSAMREGFGSKGGNPMGMTDTPHVTRSVAPRPRVGF
jgi:hypothetical protein